MARINIHVEIHASLIGEARQARRQGFSRLRNSSSSGSQALAAFYATHDVACARLTEAAPIPGLDISNTLQNILDNTDNSNKYTYPTDLTRGIIPKPIHSHNDYWRDIPFYTALSVGCISIEADVWLINETLFVGHERSALTTTRTFSSLYVEPILEVLNLENPTTAFAPQKSSTKNGVFDTSSSQTLYLFVDVKTDGPSTWPYVVKALQPLRDAGYLTTYNHSTLTSGSVTVVGTGNTPLSQILSQTSRDYFYDAPLDFLNTSTYASITSSISPIASADFFEVFGAIEGTTLNETQLATLRSQVSVAKSRGILPRYYELPAWPVTTRNAVWRTLVDEGIGLINADDLVEAAGFGGVAGYW